MTSWNSSGCSRNIRSIIPFSEAWAGRTSVKIVGADVPIIVHYLGKEALLKNKRASGRPKDLDDVQHLE
jgi:hypothetical protein